MALEFKNRKGDSFYIKSRKTKKGNPAFFLTKKKDDKCLDIMPNGYEVFEKYDTGVLYVRKKKKSTFTKEEIALVEKELRSNKSLADYKLDVHGEEIKIYISEAGGGGGGSSQLLKMLGGLGMSENKLKNTYEFLKKYEEQMRIISSGDKESRLFQISRYCYRGSIDDWIPIGLDHDFEALIRKFLPHLGKESYYDLFRF